MAETAAGRQLSRHGKVLGWSFYSQGTKERATSSDGFLDWAVAKFDIKLDEVSATQKAEKIAEALMRRRVLLVLDGVEPLQYDPGPQPGQLKDQGLRTLLRHFAATPPAAHGLLVLTSRVAVADLARFRDSAAPVVDVEHLSDAAGAVLLRDNYVWGTDRELQRASREFEMSDPASRLNGVPSGHESHFDEILLMFFVLFFLGLKLGRFLWRRK